MPSIVRLILKNLRISDRVEKRRDGETGGRGEWGNGGFDNQPETLVKDSPCLPIPLPPRHLLPSQIAAACAIPIKYERLPLAFGRVIYLAEAFLQPPGITVNLTAIEKLTACATKVPEKYRAWFTEVALKEIIIAHELYHILAQQPSGKLVETKAHNFAQAVTGLPFAPQIFEEILRQIDEWNTNLTTWELMEDKATRQH